MIDGALGMAYGVSSNTFLLSLGIPPAAASASVHMAEVVTTGISGFSHWKLGNVDWKLVKRLLIPGVLGGVALAVLFAWRHGGRWGPMSSFIETLLYGGLVGLLVYVIAWPYLAARLQQVVWSRTRLGDIAFRTDIAAGPLFRLVFKNVLLTFLTAGLYWPWAAVALARYRLECMRVESDAPLSSLAAGLQAPPVSAAGEGAADAFGLDIGL